MDPIELQVHIDNTIAYIGYKPSEIVLTPVEREKTGSGGYREVDQEERPAQTFRIIEVNSSTPPILTLTDGKQREADFLLLGAPTVDIAVNDHWLDEATGREWLVGDIVRSNLYEVRALVVERGK